MAEEKQKIEKEEVKTEVVEKKENKKSLNLPTKNKKEIKEEKIELERVYIVPLRKGFLKVPQYKRAKKAVKTLKEFLAKHMKVENRDLNKVKIDIYLNNEIWFKGIKKPLSKVKVKAKKINGIVYAELE
ncbi:MAG: 50S ribosomal protein L31e, partial [Candidatus Nanoarchaeia archaeon]|nr:50S ribosomal protein L31e [Candidatus Nanoarchaeia archaeon]